MQISFEVYPPRKPEDTPRLHEAILRLSALSPDFISVTFGAGGSSTRDSLSVLKFIRDNSSASPLAHLTCVGTTEQDAKDLVREFLGEGITDFLALRGDLPEGQSEMPPGTLSRADQLVSLIEETRPSGTGRTAVAAFPNGHPESGKERSDIAALLAKQEAGASFAITQLFFFTEDYLRFVELARARGVVIDLIPGIMPVNSVRRLERATSLACDPLPKDLHRLLSRAKSDSEASQVGAHWAARQMSELQTLGVTSAHLYAFNSAELVSRTLDIAGAARRQ